MGGKINISRCSFLSRSPSVTCFRTLAAVPCILGRRTPQTEMTSGLRSVSIMHCFVCDMLPTELQSATDGATSIDCELCLRLKIASYLQITVRISTLVYCQLLSPTFQELFQSGKGTSKCPPKHNWWKLSEQTFYRPDSFLTPNLQF